jgi:hypothetical protein
MAGTVRKRVRVSRQGETGVTWLADYYDQTGERRRKSFATKREASARLLQVQQLALTGPPLLSLDEVKRLPSALCGVYFLFLECELQRIGQSTDIGKRFIAHRNNSVRFDDCRILHCQPEQLLMLEGLYVERFRPPHNRELRRAVTLAAARD